MTKSKGVSIILPTLATIDRGACLGRALDSVLSQEGVEVDPIVVANGPGCDPDVLSALARRREIRFVHREESGLAPAISAGRDLVNAPYFAELDDDDVLLPRALATRVERIDADASIDVVVTNGFLRTNGRDVVNIPEITDFEDDPLRALMKRMWLVPCAGLYRTSTITADYFRAAPAYLEWTYLAVMLALERKISFVGIPTFVYNQDTPQSLSKSIEYVLCQPGAIKSLMRLHVPADVKRCLKERYVSSLHQASTTELARGHHARAWKWHLMTLMHWHGWRNLSYTRHLLR